MVFKASKMQSFLFLFLSGLHVAFKKIYTKGGEHNCRRNFTFDI